MTWYDGTPPPSLRGVPPLTRARSSLPTLPRVSGDAVLLLVEAHLLSVFGQDSGRAGVSFLGAERIDVLRFGPDPDGLVRYATLGMSRSPMGDPGAELVAAHGPRAELVLTVRGLQDSVLRRLAALAASPAVEGVVVGPGAGLDLGEPLWDGAPFSAVLVGEPGGLVPDLRLAPEETPHQDGAGLPGAGGSGAAGSGAGLPGAGPPGAGGRGAEESGAEEPVRFLPLLPMTPAEAAFKRVHGAGALEALWLRHGTDLRDPARPQVPLERPA